MAAVRDLTPSERPRSPLKRALLFLDAIKFQESLFALPFAYTGMLLAASGLPSWDKVLWITAAMVGARTFGMSANRILDRSIDALNPRTAGRHLPTGLLTVTDVALPALAGLALLFVAAWQLNPLALALAPVAAAYLALYSLTKRFTWTANLLLGWALAMAPSAAWIGVTGSLDYAPVLLSTAVALWAGSFDIMYHAQDRDFYEQRGLHSVAQKFGVRAAFVWARALDALALAALAGTGVLLGLAFPYYLGCAGAAALLAYRHTLVSADDMSRMGPTFFRINVYVSALVLAATVAALAVG